MALSPEIFSAEFERFKKIISEQTGGNEFVSFETGLAAEWESFKPELRAAVLGILSPESWSDSSVGSGEILNATIAAIEFHDRDKDLRNNLVSWRNDYGHASRSHRALLDARYDSELRLKLERWLFDFFHNAMDDAAAFESFREIAGNRYDLVAYLFFLKDMEKYMPIAPSSFDEAFRRLDINVVTSRKCSWSNYEEYLLTLTEVRDALRNRAGITNARLIDAHSFCWMIVRLDGSEEKASKEGGKDSGQKKDPGRIYDAREKSIYEMASSVQRTVEGSYGQTTEVTRKNKDLRMNSEALMSTIKMLLDKQENRCALTGIALQFRGEQDEDHLLPSLDRIDSSGHYELGNLQVVCRFINFWKGDSDNEEFLRLIDLVRDQIE